MDKTKFNIYGLLGFFDAVLGSQLKDDKNYNKTKSNLENFLKENKNSLLAQKLFTLIEASHDFYKYLTEVFEKYENNSQYLQDAKLLEVI